MLSKKTAFLKINFCCLILACLTLFLQSCGKGISELESLSKTNPFNNSLTNNNGTPPPTTATVTEILPPSSSTGGLISLFYQNLVAPITFPSPTFGSFYFPSDLVRDSSGNLYLLDGSNRLIRKLSPTGEVTTVAGNGGAGCTNGIATSVGLTLRRGGIVLDSSDNLYVSGSNSIRKITPDGILSTFTGTCGIGVSIVDGNNNTSRFIEITAMAIDSTGIIYAADGDRAIRRIDTSGNVLTIAGDITTIGYANGVGGAAKFW